MQNTRVSGSKRKTRARGIQQHLGAAAAELQESNRILAQVAAGSTDASVKAAVAQMLEVEKQLHAAVAEIAVIQALLKSAEAVSAVAGEAGVTPPVRRRQTK